MTTVTEQAIEAGARAIASRYDDNIIPGPLLEELPIIARAQWPILSAGLREINTGDNRALYGNDFEAGMAKALWLVKCELDRIDEDLGIDD